MTVVRAFMLVFGALAALFTCVFIWTAMESAEKEALFAREAVATDALVLRKYLWSSERTDKNFRKTRGIPDYFVVFTFKLPDGTEVEVKEEVNLTFYEAIEPDHVYRITYPRSDPSLATLYPNAYQGVAPSYLWLALYTGLFAAAMFGGWWFLHRRPVPAG